MHTAPLPKTCDKHRAKCTSSRTYARHALNVSLPELNGDFLIINVFASPRWLCAPVAESPIALPSDDGAIVAPHPFVAKRPRQLCPAARSKSRQPSPAAAPPQAEKSAAVPQPMPPSL